ncbi:MAG: E2/UBC family protein [Paracoccaceae bacterium]|jgi:hypothetical protein
MSFLPTADRRYLEERGLAFREVDDGGRKGVILPGFALPAAKFQVVAADILILLPCGYPDTAPDMFYSLPWLSLVRSSRYPNCADQPQQFESQNWQRWSRHNNSWRPGIDGIWTMLKRVEQALQEAA